LRFGGRPLLLGVGWSRTAGVSDWRASLLGVGVLRGFLVDAFGVGVPFFLLLGPAIVGVPGLPDERRRRRGTAMASASSSVRPLKGIVVVVVLRPRRGLACGVGEPNRRRLTLEPPGPPLDMGMPSGPASTVTYMVWWVISSPTSRANMRFLGEVPGRAENRDETALWRTRRVLTVEGGAAEEGGMTTDSSPSGSGDEGNSISKPDISAMSRYDRRRCFDIQVAFGWALCVEIYRLGIIEVEGRPGGVCVCRVNR
jgi:hypothetical protein